MIEIDFESILPDIEKLIKNHNQGALLNILIDLHPADIEEILNHLKKDDRKYLFEILPPELAGEVIPELDTPVVEDVLEGVSEKKISELIDNMESDDAADLVGDLPDDVAQKVLEHAEDEVSQEVKELLHYDEDTAGGIMALEFLSMPESATVNETIEKIRESRDEIDDLYSIWVIDSNERLIGNVSLTDLVLAKGFTSIREIMNIEIHYVKTDMDQEEVANFFSKYDLVSAPVVDKDKKIVGRITIDDVIDVLEEEGSEDISFIAGAPDEEIMEDSPFVLSKARVPWLLVAFLGEIVAAFILNSFEATISQKLMTAFFIPIIMAMGGSTGQQASVIVVRGLATGDIHLNDMRSRLLRELKVTLLNSSFFAILIFIIVYLWNGITFAGILAISMFVVINYAGIVGSLVPFLFKKLSIDPALAAAPFVSTSNDIVGLLIYLTITTVSLSYF
jgi:magnesium transporter